MSSTSRRRSSLSKSKLSSVGESDTVGGRAHRRKKTPLLVRWGQRLFSLSYGYFMLVVFVVRFYTMGRRWRVMDKKQKQELEDAREKIWGLSRKPYGLSHEFCTLKDSTKLHYMLSKPAIETKGKTGLVIFLHGFPDSWHVWNHVLRNGDLKSKAVLIAVDLPGYGGSDSLDKYDANNVLEVVSEFVFLMRERYLLFESEGSAARGPVILVAHDWGATIAFRLASEAAGMADRFIISNSFHPAASKANVENRLASMKRMLKTWRKAPTNTRPLFNAFATLKPVLRQVLMSGYIFIFWLPRQLGGDLLGRIGNFQLFRFMCALSIGIPESRKVEPIDSEEGWDMLASSIGPGVNQAPAVDSEKAPRYPYAVSLRAKENLGGYFEKIRYYRENLFFSRWSKSLQTVWELSKLDQSSSALLTTHSPVSGGNSSTASESPTRRRSSVGVFDLGPPGTLSAATTILWGAKDIAVHHSIAIEGIRDYFGVRPSQVVMLTQGGHWTPLEKGVREAFARVVVWAVDGEVQPLTEVVGEDGKFTVEL